MSARRPPPLCRVRLLAGRPRTTRTSVPARAHACFQIEALVQAVGHSGRGIVIAPRVASSEERSLEDVKGIRARGSFSNTEPHSGAGGGNVNRGRLAGSRRPVRRVTRTIAVRDRGRRAKSGQQRPPRSRRRPRGPRRQGMGAAQLQGRHQPVHARRRTRVRADGPRPGVADRDRRDPQPRRPAGPSPQRQAHFALAAPTARSNASTSTGGGRSATATGTPHPCRPPASAAPPTTRCATACAAAEPVSSRRGALPSGRHATLSTRGPWPARGRATRRKSRASRRAGRQ